MDKKSLDCLYGAARGMALFVCFIAASSISTFAVKLLSAMGHKLLSDIPIRFIYVICSIAAILIFNSISLAFATSDKQAISAFLKRSNKRVTFLGEIKIAFSSARSVIEIAVTHIFVAISAAAGAFSHIGGMFFEDKHSGGWFPALTLTAACFVITLTSRYEAARHHRKLDNEDNIKKVDSPLWFVQRMFVIFILYPIATPLSPLLAYAIYSFGAIVVQITLFLTILGAIAAIAALVLLIWAHAVLRGVAKRRKFIKELLSSAEENGYSVRDLNTPYKSFLNSRDHCTFTLESDSRSYSCVMISTLRKITPLIFTSPTDAHFLHRIGTKNHGITLTHKIEFIHPPADMKIVIVDPSPRKVWASERGVRKRIYCADRIWNFTVHDADSFLGAAKRHCLNKSSNAE